MTPKEAAALLGMCATVDNRKPDPDAAKAWAAMLDGLRFEDCAVAIREHFTESSEWLMPAMVRTRVRKMRAKRINEHPPLTPPADLSPVETIAWLQEARRRVADGEVIDCDAAYGELRPRNLGELRALMPKTADESGDAA